MSNLLAARLQMAVSLGFHIIFAVIGMIMPFLLVTSHWLWLKRKEQVYLDLTRVWSKGVAIFFAVGAVSGTILSFELGLLWPGFMQHAGPIIGMPFSLEGAAFFLEGIALGLYLYGWDRLRPWIHWGTGVAVGLCGLSSGVLVIAANSWMNSPAGFDWVNGQAINIDPVAALFNDAWLHQALHMSLASWIAVAFGVAGLHAFLLLREPGNRLHRQAYTIALLLAVVPALLQLLSGDLIAKDVARRQPLKLAAAEAHFETQAGAPLKIGGLVSADAGTVRYALEIPQMLSFLSQGSFDAPVRGLNDFPRENWPPVAITHLAFDLMVGIGFLLAALAVLALIFWFKKDKKYFYHPRFLKLVALCFPLGLIALEAGWTVTEVGRQPWIIYGILKTAASLTPVPFLKYHFFLFTAIYLVLAALLLWIMRRQIRNVRGY